MADDKKYLRQILREGRAALPEALVARFSQQIEKRLCGCAGYGDAATVVLYAAQDNEVATDHIFSQARASGRRVLYPRVDIHSGQLQLVRVEDRAELRPGTHGIAEPSGSATVPAAELGNALICVPGVAFSRDGCRLGYGGGYYDRLLAIAGPLVATAGLAFSFQVLDQIPQSPDDRRVDFIVTESALHHAGPAPRPALAGLDQGGEPRCS
jgi:5-formyltetrahydrofolate cyclo-ligase